MVICDRDAVIACAGLPKKEYLEKKLSNELEDIVEGRGNYRYVDGSAPVRITSDSSSAAVSCAMPIIADGDLIGCVASVHIDGAQGVEGDVENKLIGTAAAFLAKQIEA